MIVNYRGSIGYGEKFLDSLLGNIGIADVEDSGKLTQMALEQFSEEIDPKRVGVWGGSHGGFLTGHLIGHPEFKDLWGASALWNPVIDMTYMLASTDIPDWIYACCKNEEINFAQPSAEDRTLFFERSPISSVHRVKTPALFLIGDQDQRVPPHQSYFYHTALKQMGVETKLYNYPGNGHGLMKPEEHGFDASMNIGLWMDKYLMEPFINGV